MARPKKETALAVSKPSAALAVPEWAQTGKARGADKLRNTDMSWPFLRLAQDKTPQVDQKLVKIGEFFNSLTGGVYGTEVDIVVVLATVGQMRFSPFNEGGGIMCQSVDGLRAMAMNGETPEGKPTNDCTVCKFAQWTEVRGKNVAPPCTKQARYMVMVGKSLDPAILVLQRTSFPAARKLNSIIKQSGLDAFALKFKLRAKKTDKAMVVDVTADGFATKEQFTKGEQLYTSMAKAFFGRALEAAEAAEAGAE